MTPKMKFALKFWSVQPQLVIMVCVQLSSALPVNYFVRSHQDVSSLAFEACIFKA